MTFNYDVPGDDFTRAGEASGDLKKKLKKLGFPSSVIRRVSIALYEGEINMVIHANGGHITADVNTDEINLLNEEAIRNYPKEVYKEDKSGSETGKQEP